VAHYPHLSAVFPEIQGKIQSEIQGEIHLFLAALPLFYGGDCVSRLVFLLDFC